MPPRTLWKYGAIERYTSVIDGLVRFTQPADLNDPFDANPSIDVLLSENSIDKACVSAISEYFDGDFNSDFSSEALASFVDPKTISDSYRKAIFDYAASNVLDNDKIKAELKTTASIVANLAFNKAGVFCLSETNDNILMWSHYANQHRGIAVGYNGHHSFFNREGPQLEFRLAKIKYTAKRPKKLSDIGKEYRVFFEKSPDWKYEKEWRVIARLTNATTVINPDNECPIHLFQMPLDAIESIVFGMNTPKDIILKTIIEITEKTLIPRLSKDIPQIRFYQAIKHPTLFKVEIEELMK